MKKYFLVLILLFLSHVRMYSQDDAAPVVTPDIPQFFLDVLNVKSDQRDMGRLDLYIEVPYTVLRFTKENNTFHSAYEVTVNVYDGTDKLVEDKWWTERIETKTYEESVSPTVGDVTQRTIQLSPGTYTLSVQIKDAETQKTSRIKRKVAVQNFSAMPFALSDIMMVRHVDTISQKEFVYPNISATVGDVKDSCTIFFETYNSVDAESEQIYLAVENMTCDAALRDTFTVPLGSARVSCFHQVATSKLIAGNYVLKLTAVPNTAYDSDGVKNPEAKTSRMFIVRWHGMPVSITNLDLAIEQLQYFADKDVLDEMKKAPPEKKKELFDAFWKKRDPTPNTERNELMEEYYTRVMYANKHFGHFFDGWKSDMGMVYIIFGVPNNIEQHPFEIDARPYEIWSYYDQNRQFVFIDYTGFGDYRLQNPIWDVDRTRIR
jgi:GWxTD domain-containing protein